jgi:hypothetical protein
LNLRELAEADLARTLEDTSSAGAPFTLIDTKGVEYPVTGTVGDIGIVISPVTGERVSSRSIVCACRIKTLSAQTPEIPARGWKARLSDVNGNVIQAFVQGSSPDRTLGIYNLVIGLDVEVENE